MAHRAGPANHVEMVHRPGEGPLAAKLFDLLGLQPNTLGTALEGTVYQYSNDLILWVSDVTPEQWAFEQWLQQRIEDSGDAVTDAFAEMGRVRPQKFGHFGIGHPSLPKWEAAIERIRDAAANDPDLRGRISIPTVERPEDAHSVSSVTGGKMGPRLWQGFLRTDIVSTGLLTLGQTIEVQYMTAYDPAHAHEKLALETVG